MIWNDLECDWVWGRALFYGDVILRGFLDEDRVSILHVCDEGADENWDEGHKDTTITKVSRYGVKVQFLRMVLLCRVVSGKQTYFSALCLYVYDSEITCLHE